MRSLSRGNFCARLIYGFRKGQRSGLQCPTNCD
nr:MAG TPA: hypothetical protein [Caudoviricetes sp.]